ncbi:MAG: amidohydrolase family protein [Acidimicrobiia bacterium]|nr:amidohydrolase family protein [bacterium]MXX01243.1 amidohydrolase family protein [Acidimicrobiia bacterium]MDE0675554.1 amidohydrolase family protein [bacterium]MXY75162.1 amidohydrolase family protein [Acidimicrobiia bacterium]MYA39710.1 amidohydrolase family protein [Acidimicrobiia bacterium]
MRELPTNPRRLADGDLPLAIGPVRVPEYSGSQVISVHRGLITGIEPFPNGSEAPVPEPSHLAMPSFAEPHLHPDRAYVGSPRPPRSLEDAIETGARPEGYIADTAAERARRLFSTLSDNGATRARGHVGRHPEHIAAPRWEVMGEVREQMKRVMEIELVAFAVADTLTDREETARLQKDLTMGRYQLIGGSPNHDSRPRESITSMMELAARTGVQVDVHIDETLDPARLLMDFALDEVERRHLEGWVSFSHCCLLSALGEQQTRSLARRMAGLGITVNCQPRTNLILHEYRVHSPRRALAPINLLIEEGVHVRLGVDNVDDTFCPFSTADPLEAAYLARLAGHLYDDARLISALTDGRSTLRSGDKADLTFVEAKNLNEALSLRPERITMREGVVVASGSN